MEYVINLCHLKKYNQTNNFIDLYKYIILREIIQHLNTYSKAHLNLIDINFVDEIEEKMTTK
jgi:hypothetical protein